MDDTKYVVKRKLGFGCHGKVYVATSRESKKDFAIKIARKADHIGRTTAKTERDVSFFYKDCFIESVLDKNGPQTFGCSCLCFYFSKKTNYDFFLRKLQRICK